MGDLNINIRKGSMNAEAHGQFLDMLASAEARQVMEGLEFSASGSVKKRGWAWE